MNFRLFFGSVHSCRDARINYSGSFDPVSTPARGRLGSLYWSTIGRLRKNLPSGSFRSIAGPFFQPVQPEHISSQCRLPPWGDLCVYVQ